MPESWHNFFYGAFDPQGTITLDKLPGAFWVQALSVRVFGYSPWAMVLPQVVESVLTIFVLYRAVRRVAGAGGALVAAAVLAASPVTVGSTRGNLSEPLYLLFLVLAADAALRAIVQARRRSWYVAAIWVGLAFQAKMTEAWLVFPVLGLALPAGTPTGRLRMVLRVGLGTLVMVAVSLVWVLGFAVTPAADRPVVDGIVHNSIFEQMFAYNGFARFGSSEAFGLKPLAPFSDEAVSYTESTLTPAVRTALSPPANLSQPSRNRLAAGVLAPDCAWFLPLALLGAVAALVARRGRGCGDPVRAAVVLWGGWLLVYGAAFSSAQLLQNYCLATLVPAIAALSGIGFAGL